MTEKLANEAFREENEKLLGKQTQNCCFLTIFYEHLNIYIKQIVR